MWFSFFTLICDFFFCFYDICLFFFVCIFRLCRLLGFAFVSDSTVVYFICVIFFCFFLFLGFAFSSVWFQRCHNVCLRFLLGLFSFFLITQNFLIVLVYLFLCVCFFFKVSTFLFNHFSNKYFLLYIFRGFHNFSCLKVFIFIFNVCFIFWY